MRALRLEGLIPAAIAVAVAGAAWADDPAHLAGQPAVDAAQARGHCIPALIHPHEACTVAAFGPLGEVAGQAFAHARYEVTPAAGDPLNPLPYRRAVIFQAAAGGRLRPILISGDDPSYYYEAPELIRTGAATLLHVPANEDGAGNFNRELLYVWDGAAWRDVDVATWQDDLARQLPKGQGIQKGVYPDYATMTADTPVWRNKDSGVCATAGRIRITLALKDARIVLVGFRHERAGECGEDPAAG